ncbi:MAG: bifunctional 5,10-methylenetetrahydrofolate dehydrogenase/5,10-methenyltetrahydrofolate cyclohydrolase [Alphaproteobacteria bacterium]|nr:bifunctional 5,10-methylenetetrahydrofolate dehydrogenase/5,10-methenyltetrahydrofolate cyclohydrolase [Alphaproteobacteria bacterium]
MTAQIIDGKKIAAEIRDKLKKKIALLPSAPQLAIVLVGNDEPSLIYVRNKQKAAAQIGLLSQLYHLDENISEEELLEIIAQLNNDSEINGIIVQLPLPKHLNTNRVINAISPLKDVDGFHPYNTGMLQNNEKPYFVAATPLGVMQLIKSVLPNLSGKNVVLIGASLIVGRPLATLLLNQECTVTITHAQTRNIKELTSKADILVAACGVAKLVKADWIKENAVLIDVGINRDNGKICGDIDFDDVKEKALAITPVPGGVGPMTIAMLLSNTVDAFLLQHAAL